MANETVIYESPDQGALISEADGFLACAKEIIIESSDMYSLAADELRTIKARAKELDEKRKSITVPLDNAKKAVMELFRKPIELLTEAEGVLKRGMLTYSEEQEAVRRAEQARLDAIAKAERERIEAIARAERDHIEAEFKARAVAEAKAAAEAIAAAKGKAAKAAALKAAEEAAILAAQDRQRQEDEAAAIELTASVITAPVAHIAKVAAAGTSIREVWKARCTDKAVLIKFVSINPQFLNLLDVNDTALNQLAKAMKDSMNIGGCEAYIERGIASRATERVVIK